MHYVYKSARCTCLHNMHIYSHTHAHMPECAVHIHTRTRTHTPHIHVCTSPPTIQRIVKTLQTILKHSLLNHRTLALSKHSLDILMHTNSL